MKRLHKLFRLNAVTIAVIYLVFGSLWILFSDQLLSVFVNDIETLSRYSSIKGILYVTITGVLLYFLIQFNNDNILVHQDKVDKALDSAQVATWSIDLETSQNITSSNHYKLFGIKKKPKDLDLIDYYSFIHPDYQEDVKKAFEEALEKQQPYITEYKIIGDDGTVKWMRSQGGVGVNDAGKAIRFSGITEDITQTKMFEEEFEREKELFERIFEQIPVMVDIYDPEINSIRVNEAFVETMGWTNEEIRNIDLISECYPDPKEREKARKVMSEADGSSHEFEVQDKFGNTHIQEWSNIQLSDKSIIGIGLDVTELKASQDEITESRNLLQMTFESLVESVFIIEPKTRTITDCNKSCTELFGYTKNELIGSTTRKLHVNEEAFKKFDKIGTKDLNEKGSFRTEFKMQKKDGTTFYSNHTVSLVKNEGGEVEKVVSVVQDITDQKKYEQELKERTDFIETTLENLPIGVAVNLIDTGEATLMNKRFAEIYGWSKETLKDVNSFFEHVYPDEKYRESMVEMITADLSSKNPQRMNWEGVKITTQTGDTKIVNAKNIPVYEQNLMISTVVDVTDRIQAETRLAESEHNYRLLFQKSPLPMWIYNPKTLNIIEVNNAAVKHYEYSRKEFYRMNLMDIRPEEDREQARAVIENDNKKSLSEAGEFRHLKKSGEVIYVRVSGAAINYFGKDYRFILVNDITEQKKAEEMVLASIVEGENKERSRIAQELHDGLGQYLAAANMNFDSLKNSIENFSKKKQDQFKNGLNLLKNAIAETGQISRNLMPRVVDDYGLALAIESLVDSYQNNSSISLDYYHNIKGLELPREIQFNLYRIAQEALSNAIKYAEATKINVQLVKDELDLILTIDDNGIGFDVNDKDFKAGLGLQTIKTRTGALGGYFEFDTKPNSGTFLNIVVPINNNTSNADG